MSFEINDIKKLNIEGYLTDPEGETLYKLARHCKGNGAIVEIGSWKGKSTVWIASGLKSRKNSDVPFNNPSYYNKVYAIDPHEGLMKINEKYQEDSTFHEFINNIKSTNLDDIVVPIVKTSEEASKEFNQPIEFIFIDGLHEYEYSLKDFILWFPKVIENGWMAFHDTLKPTLGPKKVVIDKVYKSNLFKNINFIETITFAQKTSKIKLIDKIKNKYTYYLFNAHSLIGSSKMPRKMKKILQRIIKILKIKVRLD